MKIEFTVSNAADAARAADILDYIASTFGDEISQQDTSPRERRPRRTKAEMAASAAMIPATTALPPTPPPPRC